MPSRFLSPCFLLPLHSGHAVWSCGSWCPEFFMERGGREGGRSIGVSECSNRAYISSSLCPGQRVQQLHAVFSIPSPPPAPLSLFLPPSFPVSLALSVSLSLSWLSDCTFSLRSGIPSSCTWPALKRARCVCDWVCVFVRV